MSAGRLFWVQRDGGIVELPMTKARIVLGRGSECDVKLSVPSVSGRHAVIHQSSSGVSIEDLQSTNGTRVNGKRVDTLPLKHGDQVELGSERFVFFTDAALPAGDFSRLAKLAQSKSAQADGEPTQRLRPAERPASAPGINATLDMPSPFPTVSAAGKSSQRSSGHTVGHRGFITVMSGRASGKRFALTKDVTTLGQEGMQVFQIVLRDEGFYAVRGPNSTAPFVNGVAVDSAQGVRLSHNDMIELTGAIVRFEIEAG
jgi:predicted component of type VI protein secretion system